MSATGAGGNMFRIASRAGVLASVVIAVGSAVGSVPAPNSKLHSVLQIRPGLWEFISTANVSGDTVFPETLLARVPAGHRAGHLAELRRMMSQPSRERECISQAVFERQLFTAGSGCKQAAGPNTVSRLEVVTECQSQSGAFKQRSTSKAVASSPTAVTTSMHAVSMQSGKTMIVDSVQRGRWIGASCGNVRGIEVQH